MKRLTAAAILTATAAALACRPVREWIGDAMIDAGIRLAYGEPPPMTPRPPKTDVARAWANTINPRVTLDADTLARLDAELRAASWRNGNSPI